MVVDYKEYAIKVFPNSNPSSISLDSWRPPLDGWIKVNFDAFVGAGCRRGLGIVCRNAQGDVLVTGSKLCRANWNPEVSEMMAAKYGLEVCRRMGFEKVHVEGDARNVIYAIIHREKGRAPANVIFDSIFSFLDSFVDVKASHVRRGGNTVAHLVARWGTEFGHEKICMPPFCDSIRSLAELDLS